ncbi:MAG: TerB family tellurite resistance protein [Fibrobacterota bacterium]
MGKNSWLWGAGIGFILGGPIGAVVGGLIGHSFSGNPKRIGNTKSSSRHSRMQGGDFVVSSLMCLAYVSKSDGKVHSAEVNSVKSFLIRTFGNETAGELMQLFKKIVKSDFDISDVCSQIAYYAEPSEILTLVHLLFEVSKSDGEIVPDEEKAIRFIAKKLGVTTVQYNSIRAHYLSYGITEDGDYGILGLKKSASKEEINKAYRELAKKYHPDKVSHLGPEFRELAENKFREINQAYDRLKKK